MSPHQDLRVLHVAGSSVDSYWFKVSLLYASDVIKPRGVRESFAIVRQDGRSVSLFLQAIDDRSNKTKRLYSLQLKSWLLCDSSFRSTTPSALLDDSFVNANDDSIIAGPVTLAEALDHVENEGPDLVVSHLFDQPGVTAFRGLFEVWTCMCNFNGSYSVDSGKNREKNKKKDRVICYRS